LIQRIPHSCSTFYKVQGIDWDAIQIESRWEEEGPQETICEDVVYNNLGLKHEDEKGNKQQRKLQIEELRLS
jgi:hypothetical protein